MKIFKHNFYLKTLLIILSTNITHLAFSPSPGCPGNGAGAGAFLRTKTLSDWPLSGYLEVAEQSLSQQHTLTVV